MSDNRSMRRPLINSFVAIASTQLIFLTGLLGAQITPEAREFLSQLRPESLLILRGSSRQCEATERRSAESFCLKLRMELVDRSMSRVIIINPTLAFGTGLRKAVFQYRIPAVDPNTGHRADTESDSIVELPPSKSEMESLRTITPLLDTPAPSENLTVILEPGESFIFGDTLDLELPVRYDDANYRWVKDKQTGKYIKVKTEIRPYGVQLFYEFSFLNLASDPDYLEHLSQRWLEYGVLPVSSDGTYRITSKGFSLR